MAPRSPKTSLVWPKGQARPAPTQDRDLMRRLLENPQETFGGPWLEWLKARLELEPPSFVSAELGLDCGCEDDCFPMLPCEPTVGVGNPRFLTGCVDTGTETFGAAGPVIPFSEQGFANVGPYRDNYESGGRLMAWVKNLDCSGIDQLQLHVSGVGFEQILPITIPNGIFNSAYYVFDDTGASLAYGAEQNLVLHGSTYLGLSSGVAFGGTVCWGWISASDPRAQGFTERIELGAADGDALQWVDSTQSWEPTTTLAANARVGVRINSTGTPSKRRTVNVIEGNGIDLTVADDSGNEEVDLTVTVDGSEISVTSLSFPGGSNFLRADGTFQPVITNDRLVCQFMGTPVVGGGYPAYIPRGAGDTDITIDLERLALRLEVPASSGTTTAILQKATGGGAPTWSDVATISITAGNYEATDQTIGAFTLTSGDLLRLYFTAVGTGADGYTGTATGTEV